MNLHTETHCSVHNYTYPVQQHNFPEREAEIFTVYDSDDEDLTLNLYKKTKCFIDLFTSDLF